MPIGVIVNALATALGGLIGAGIGNRIPNDFKENLNMIFGGCAMCMGISTIVKMENIPAVILSTILGTVIGLLLHLGDHVNAGGRWMQGLINRIVKTNTSSLSEEDFQSQLLTAIILFVVSGTGIYGSIVSGISGDHSIMLAKTFLDLPTALIFACSLGAVVSLIAIPQFIFFLFLFLLAGWIFPLTTPSMINDFKACGGLLILVTGFRILKLKNFPIAEMIPSLIIVMPLSWFWSTYILPWVS